MKNQRPLKGYVPPDLLLEAGKALEPLKQISYDRMKIRPGDRVLDLGCGAGYDIPALCSLVGPEGEVHGWDNDPEMSLKMDKTGLNVQNTVQLAHKSAHENAGFEGYFNALRADRLIQHLDDPEACIRNAYTLLAPGGRFVVLDTDWTSFTIECPERPLERAISGFVHSEGVASPWAAKAAHRLFCEAGFVNVVSETFVQRLSGQDLPGSIMEEMEEAVVSNGLLTTNEMARWREYRQRAFEGGYFYSSLNFVLTTGRRSMFRG